MKTIVALTLLCRSLDFVGTSLASLPCQRIHYIATRDRWDPQRRTVVGEHLNDNLLGFKHKCTACSGMEAKGKAAATSKAGGVSYF